MNDSADLGKPYSLGSSFRARAEARQREYRARTLKAGCSKYGHILDAQAADAGCNFVVRVAHEAARRRAAEGKGVIERTFNNMLASQAMCFNVFVPLALDTNLAADVLQPFFPGLAAVRTIDIEHTPSADIFGDQRGLAGVDCDVLVDGEWDDGATGVVTIETKLVETEFSRCGIRRDTRRRLASGQPICPDDIAVRADRSACLYTSEKRYRYWEQTDRLGTLGPEALGDRGCPFSGPLWQLWVNHTLAHAEAERRGARRVVFAVVAPAGNDALLGDGVLDGFHALVARETFAFVPLDNLIERIATVAAGRAGLGAWSGGLVARYAGI